MVLSPLVTFRTGNKRMEQNDNAYIGVMGEEKEYVCVWKIRIDRTDIHFFHQAHSSLLPRYKWFCCAAVRLRSICTISLKIKRLTVQLSFADYTMPMRIKQTCLFSSNNSLRGYVRVCMIMLIAWLPKSKSTTPLCPHASVWSSQQIQGWFPSVWPERPFVSWLSSHTA